MAFKIVAGELSYTGTLEDSVVEALIKYPGLKVLVTTQKDNNVDAAISFYVNVCNELKNKYLLDTDGLDTKYSNGSELIFMGNANLTDGKYTSIASHILIVYGNISEWQVTKLTGALLSYDMRGEKIFPIVVTEEYKVFGTEAEKMAAECKKEYEENFTAGRQGRKKKK